jgi:hypothetical protein
MIVGSGLSSGGFYFSCHLRDYSFLPDGLLYLNLPHQVLRKGLLRTDTLGHNPNPRQPLRQPVLYA